MVPKSKQLYLMRKIAKKVKLGKDGCWEWQGAISNKGYGIMRAEYKGPEVPESGMIPVHRLAYILYRGPFPSKFQLDHICENRKCCNPAHLQILGPVEHAKKSNVQKEQKK